jgi:UDP-hydrolysing UDP-N-acetyl-D-glucosamine 2-epimerase
MPRKICVVITARPSYSRVKTALRAIQAHPDLELQLVVTASALLDRYGEVVKFIEADGFTITTKVYMVLEGENPASMAKTTGLGVLELATVFDNLRPDAVVTIADRYETIATAIAAAYLNIPLVHIQGGEVTGSIDEKVRHAVTKLADLHLVSNEHAAERVRRLGEDPAAVHVTGCPSIDIAADLHGASALDFNIFERYGGVGGLKELNNGYLIVMQHPVTNEHAQAYAHVTETLHAIAAIGMPTLWFWPNVDAGADGTSKAIRAYREYHDTGHIRFFKHMDSLDFLRVACNCKVLIGNSSVGIRECAYLGVPVVNIGSRQAGRDRGANVLDVGYSQDAIAQAIQAQIAHGRYAPDLLYGDGRAGERIAQLLATAEFRTEKRLAY